MSNKIKSQIWVISSVKEIDTIDLNKSEKKFVKSKLKKSGDVAEITNLNEISFVVWIGKKLNHLEKEKIRKIGAGISKKLNALKVSDAIVDAVSKNNNALLLVEGMALSNYQFLKYYNDKKERTNALKNIFVKEGNIDSRKIEELWITIDAVAKSRDLVNEPLSFLNAVQLSKEIKALGKEAGFSVEVLDHRKIESLKMGGLLAVNAGSIDPATFSILEHKPKNAKNKKPLVLVGKGVVYDTGGLSLKPTANSMDIMKCDMGGAAAVIGGIYAIAKANLNVHVIGLIPATDNRPGGNAYAPGDVIKMYSGKTVEVLNTDAEGRMIMADALHYAKKYNPDLVMDFATLTGAAMRAIGSHASVVMGTAKKSQFDNVKKAGDACYERMFEMPFYEEYGDEIKSDIADIKNIGGPTAGAITAGKFLEHFTDYPWVHVDIAGPAWANAASGYVSKGGTGVGVRFLFEFVKQNY